MDNKAQCLFIYLLVVLGHTNAKDQFAPTMKKPTIICYAVGVETALTQKDLMQDEVFEGGLAFAAKEAITAHKAVGHKALHRPPHEVLEVQPSHSEECRHLKSIFL